MNIMVDRICEAAVVLLWIDVLDRISAIARCDRGILMLLTPTRMFEPFRRSENGVR